MPNTDTDNTAAPTATTTTTVQTVPTRSSTDPHVSRTLDFLSSIFASYPRRDFDFRLWDGTQWLPSGYIAPSLFTVVLNHPGSLRRMFLPPTDVRLGLAYTFGDFDLEGDASQALNLGKYLWVSWSWVDIVRNAWKLLRLPDVPPRQRGKGVHMPDDGGLRRTGEEHSRERDMKAVQFHYDVSNDFYKLWLDRNMVYSCAYFDDRNVEAYLKDDEESIGKRMSLEDAQTAKLDLVCRKLRIKPGDKVLDVGCGWGAFAIHAATHYGAQVVAISLSEAQVAEARTRVSAAGLCSDQVDIRVQDYRALLDKDKNNDTGQFDKIVSIGMVEHVGRENLEEYFDACYKLVKPGGVMMNHGITLLHDRFASREAIKRGFFARFIFPDGDVQPLQYVLDKAGRVGWETRDVECLREHYMLTLNEWRRRFDANQEEIVSIVGRETFRLWRLYLIGAGWGFKTGMHGIYQTVLYKRNEEREGCALAELGLTRRDWYDEEEGAAAMKTKEEKDIDVDIDKDNEANEVDDDGEKEEENDIEVENGDEDGQ